MGFLPGIHCKSLGGLLQVISPIFSEDYQDISICAISTNQAFYDIQFGLLGDVAKSRSKLSLVSMWKPFYKGYNAHNLGFMKLFDLNKKSISYDIKYISASWCSLYNQRLNTKKCSFLVCWHKVYAFSFERLAVTRDLAEARIQKTMLFHQRELLNKLGR